MIFTHPLPHIIVLEEEYAVIISLHFALNDPGYLFPRRLAGGAVDSGTMPQDRRSRVRFPVGSLKNLQVT